MMPLLTLSEPDVFDVRKLAEMVAASDGVGPLNEEALLSLGDAHASTRHWLARDNGTLAGYAQWNPEHGTAQLTVHPGYRRLGFGTQLSLSVTATSPRADFWAFGDLAPARQFAAHLGLTPVRGLLRMGRPLTPADALSPAEAAATGFRSFSNADASALLAVNAAAFAGHPEQGSFSLADLDARRAAGWFDPEGLLLAEDDQGVVGFHWTKITPEDPRTGEVYVIGVHPRAAGRGLGAALLRAGLAHLLARGCSRVILYVDEGNETAVNLYRRSGFDTEHIDRLYGPRVSNK